MSWILATAGGKDATLALHRARAEGLQVRWGLNVFEGDTELVRFHGTPRSLLEVHLRALGLEPLLGRTHPRGFEEVFLELLARGREAGARGILFGNLHLTDIRDWYRQRVESAGIEHREPLWGTRPARVVREVVDLGYRTTITSVHLELGDPEWLGRELSPDLLDDFVSRGIDPAGERGEYHTFVSAGPGFSRSVPFRVTGRDEREGHRFLRLEGVGGAD